MGSLKCRKCGCPVHVCPHCKGQTRTNFLGDTLTCRTCQNTGYLCGTHDGYWK